MRGDLANSPTATSPAVSNALGYHSYSDNINNKGGKTEVTYDCTWIKGDSSEAIPP